MTSRLDIDITDIAVFIWFQAPAACSR